MKKIVCACHDISQEDIESAIEHGYDDLETLKRITGVTTGWKVLLEMVFEQVLKETGSNSHSEVTARMFPPFTYETPNLTRVSFNILANSNNCLPSGVKLTN